VVYYNIWEEIALRYTQIVQNTITYIEHHLCEKISLSEISQRSGFSKYHFIRIFKGETGKGISEYIQCRRLLQASRLLLSSELSIMEIALIYQFDSQEAFTHAFKREFTLPPGRYRRTMSNLIKRKDHLTMKQNQIIPGWIFTGSTPKSYEVKLDFEVHDKGSKSIVLKNKEIDLEEGSYSTILQQFKAKNYIGNRVRFSGYIKSQDVTGWGGLWMRVNSITANIIKIDNMQNRPIKGTTDWTYYSVVLDIPENSSIINIGLLLYDTGTLWLDNIVFEIVDDSVSTTDVDLSYDLPEGPINLTLEDQ
jgi:AraC-like DNA-binding protein